MNLKTATFFACLLVLTGLLPAQAQSESKNVQLDATGEFRSTDSEISDSGRKLAVAIARRNLLRDAATYVRDIDEVRASPLKPGQIDAFLPAILEIKQGVVRSEKQANGTVYKASVTVRSEPRLIARRLDKLRKDPNTVTALMEVAIQADSLYALLASANAAKVQDGLAVKLGANQLMAEAYAALAKTEESPASVRVSSGKGRQRAMLLAEASVVAQPELPEAHILLGDVLADLNQAPAAEAAYRQAVLIDPSSPRVHIKLADALRRQERIPEAIAELREALRFDPNSAVAHSDLGYALGSQQNTAESIAEFREAIRLDQDLVEAHNYLAIALARQGKFPDAVAEFREVIRSDPESVLGYYNLALALADMEKDDESAEALRQVVRINPNHFNAHYNLGELFRLDGKFDDAVKQFREYLRLAPNIPQSQRNIQRAEEFVRTHENK